jgi:signal transduction histidine kinase/ActR/RegA family two-component response regulator
MSFLEARRWVRSSRSHAWFSGVGWVLVAVAVCLFGYLRWREDHQQVTHREERVASYGRFVAAAAETGVVFGDPDAVVASYRGLLSDSDLVYVRVVDPLGHPIAGVGDFSTAPWPHTPPDHASTVRKSAVIHVAQPMVSSRGKTIGAVEIGYSIAGLLSQRRAVDTLAVSFMVLLGVAALLLQRGIGVRRKMEEQLMHSDRLASLGRLSASIAHEINNPLTFVSTNITYALENLPGAVARRDDALGAEIAAALQDCKEGAERIRKIVADLKSFARGSASGMTAVPVVAAVDKALKIAAPEIKQRGQLVLDASPVPAVTADEGRLVQVLVNLLVNASHALEGAKGVKEVRLRTRVVGDRVEIQIEDTGTGMTREVRRRLFEPFFTTKPQGVGTGLGLFLCHSIVTSFQGEITVDTERGKGSTFRVRLPIAPPPEASVAPTPASGAGRSRILLVDDEPQLVAALSRALSLRHEIVTAGGGAEAIEKILHGPPLDGIVCDLMMPGVSGIEVFDRVVRERPSLRDRFVFITGAASHPLARAFLDRCHRPWFEKPFPPDALDRALSGSGDAHAAATTH